MVLSLAGSVEAKSIGRDQVNIRSAPNTNSSIVFTAPLGYPIKIEKEANNWSFFHDWQNNTGWVYKPLVSDTETAVILVEMANIRGKASINSQVVATAKLGEIYTILAKNGNWVKLGYYHGDSEVGWIRNDLIFGE
jgi:SH3-like domain-containing protein